MRQESEGSESDVPEEAKEPLFHGGFQSCKSHCSLRTMADELSMAPLQADK